MTTPIKRKLAAILSADVAGYSRLMAADEEGTLRVLAAHRAVIDAIIGLHDGRVVNTAGDSVLAEFSSPVEAVRAASEIQDALRTRNESLAEASRMSFRIGIHLGDVMIQGDDLLGDGVNVAARLQAVAEPGGICISGTVFDQIEGKLSLSFHDIGEQTLRNIARPVRALVLRGAAAGPGVSRPRRGRRPQRLAALVVGGLVVLAAGAYLAGPGLDLGGQGRREAAAWDAVRESRDVATLEGYLATFPDGLHAGEARARVTSLLAEARGAMEAERARAEAERARLKAGEAEAARVRAEADAARVKLEAAKARVVPAPAAATATVPSGVRETRFDGVWIGEIVCPDWRGRPGFRRPQRVTVDNGEMTLDMALPGRPRPLRSTGRVASDDSVELRGPGIGPAGKVFEHVFTGRFSAEGFTAQAAPPARPCALELARERASARP